MGRHGSMDGHDSADGLHGPHGLYSLHSVVAALLYIFDILPAVMKPITMAATTTATAPAPEMRPNPARNGTMIRTIKADFDQSGDLSTLVSRLIVQQRWAYNMAVEKTLKDPAITSFDLY